jgi:hypothetical protein
MFNNLWWMSVLIQIISALVFAGGVIMAINTVVSRADVRVTLLILAGTLLGALLLYCIGGMVQVQISTLETLEAIRNRNRPNTDK